jgi:predicted  nucleic acid-binding Zn-ribbon protein
MNPEDIREKISDHVETILQDIEKLNIKMGILSTRDPKPQDEIDQLNEEVKALYQQAIKVVEAEKRFERLSEDLQ